MSSAVASIVTTHNKRIHRQIDENDNAEIMDWINIGSASFEVGIDKKSRLGVSILGQRKQQIDTNILQVYNDSAQKEEARGDYSTTIQSLVPP